ncbi:PEP-CTERM sorting domain-containing protein [Poriferisphaera sp. WC338]|uniref:PEP-CTERM sorting domain-containing protein n=1 Tax=Poriferisphaera sp. WC338 TaxID=3425129 RepID=UPI003D81A034
MNILKKSMTAAVCVSTFSLLAADVSANIDIVFDYSTDTSGFFDLVTHADGSTGATRRARLNEAASFYENAFQDTLSAITVSNTTNVGRYIDPVSGSPTSISSPISIAENEIRVFVGSQNQGSLAWAASAWYSPFFTSWMEGTARRGQGDIHGSNAVDTAMWGGSISFDTSLSSGNWWWGDQNNDIPDRVFAHEPIFHDFLSTAIHELGHLLGFSDNADSFDNLLSGNTFTGTNAVAAYAAAGGSGNVPTVGNAHWQDGLLGDSLAMDPTLTNNTRKLLTDLDWAAFQDIGWEVVIPEPTSIALLSLGSLFVMRRKKA